MKVLIQVPFSGFYESIHDSLISDAAASDIVWHIAQATGSDACCYYDLNTAETSVYDDAMWGNSGVLSRNFWRESQKKYAAEYCNRFGDKYNLSSVTFESMRSPRFYNFETDRLFAHVEYKELQAMLVPRKKEFVVWAENNIHSRDGFILFSEYHPQEWVRKPSRTWDFNMWHWFLSWAVQDDEEDYPLVVDNAEEYLATSEIDYTRLSEMVGGMSN